LRRLIHITDLHFGRITPGILDSLQLNIRESRPDLCIISGDLTMRSRPREWRQARAFLDRLTVPCMVIPGNHDLPYVNLYERFTDPYGRFQKYVNEELNPTFRDGELAIAGVNTARPWVPHYTWKEGSFSREQVEHVESFFRSAGEGLFKIVFTHHPFLPPPEKPDTYLVRHARRALRVFEAVGVDLLLGGHLHLSYRGDITTHFSMIKRSIICAQASTATSSRLRNNIPNGFNVIVIDGDRVEIHSREWAEDTYTTVSVDTFLRTATGWIPRQAETPMEAK